MIGLRSTLLADVLADKLVGKILVLTGYLEQFLAAPLVHFGLGRVAHLRGESAIVLCAREIVLHRRSVRCDEEGSELR